VGLSPRGPTAVMRAGTGCVIYDEGIGRVRTTLTGAADPPAAVAHQPRIGDCRTATASLILGACHAFSHAADSITGRRARTSPHKVPPTPPKFGSDDTWHRAVVRHNWNGGEQLRLVDSPHRTDWSRLGHLRRRCPTISSARAPHPLERIRPFR